MIDALKSMFKGLRASASGMTAERTRIDTVAQNIANAQVTRMPDGSGPYRRQLVRFAPMMEKVSPGVTEITGVRVIGVEPDTKTPLERVRMPGHPDADAEGYVSMPNVDPTLEMADLIGAVRAYEANANAVDGFVRMAERALRIAQ